MFEKIGNAIGLVYDSLKDKEGGFDLIAKVDEAPNDNELKKGFREIISYMKNNNMEKVASKIESDLIGWL